MGRQVAAQWLGAVARVLLLGMFLYALLVLKSGTVLAVQTASMVPTFSPGDALVIETSVKRFKVGQIVSYRSRNDPRQTVSHRVIDVQENQQRLVTKGDNLSVADPPIRTWDVIGTAVYILPKAGYVISFMYSWQGLASMVYLPAILVLVFEVRRLHLPRKWVFITAR